MLLKSVEHHILNLLFTPLVFECVHEPTVGYTTIAFNVTLPLNSYDASTIGNYVPCHNQVPAFPALDGRTADTSQGQKTALQLSRLTVVLDEKSISGGKGNGICFVSYLSPEFPHPCCVLTFLNVCVYVSDILKCKCYSGL